MELSIADCLPPIRDYRSTGVVDLSFSDEAEGSALPAADACSRAVLTRYHDARMRGLSNHQAIREAACLLWVFQPTLSSRATMTLATAIVAPQAFGPADAGVNA
jgi:hypothetical protein